MPSGKQFNEISSLQFFMMMWPVGGPVDDYEVRQPTSSSTHAIGRWKPPWQAVSHFPIGDLWYLFITQLLNIFQLSELFFLHLLREFQSGLEDVGGGDANTQLEGRRDCHRGTRGEQRGEGRWNWFQQVVLGILGLGVNQDWVVDCLIR